MKIRTALAGLVTVAGLAASANAQNVMNLVWSSSHATANVGDVVTLTLTADWAPARIGFAGSIFNIKATNGAGGTIGNAEGGGDTEGSFLGRNPTLRFVPGAGGTADASGNITGPGQGIDTFQLPPFFNPSFNSKNPLVLYKFTYTVTDGTLRTITYTSEHINADVYDNTTGTSIRYTQNIVPASFDIVPAPASLALLGMGGLVAARRRRA